MISIEQLSKAYGKVQALDQVDLRFESGQSVAVIGPNGSGKTTLIKCLLGMVRPTTGSIYFMDKDIAGERAYLSTIGYMPQIGRYPDRMKVGEVFELLKGIRAHRDQPTLDERLIEAFKLADISDQQMYTLSGGTRQKVSAALAFLFSPSILMLDEPTAGLDPTERQRFLNVLREVGTNSTVIFSTHIVDDVKELCNDMAILNGGKILKHIKPVEATKEIKDKIWVKIVERKDLDKAEEEFNILSSNYNVDNSLTIRVYNEKKPGVGFKKSEPQLDDVYFIALKEDQINEMN